LDREKPLDYVKGFPVQLIEVFDPLNTGRKVYTPAYDELRDNWHYLKRLKIILWGKRVFIRLGVESKRNASLLPQESFLPCSLKKLPAEQ